METLTKAVIELEKFMYSPWFVITLLGTGVLYTLRTRFIQFRKLGTSWKQIYRGALKKDDTSQKKGDITPFMTLPNLVGLIILSGFVGAIARKKADFRSEDSFGNTELKNIPLH